MMEQGNFTGTNEGMTSMPAGQREEPRVDEHRLFMRSRYSFFGGVSILYALFFTFCLYKNMSGITYPFFVAGTLFFFYLCTEKSGVPWKGGSGFYTVSILLLGISVFLTDNSFIIFTTQAGITLLLLCLMLHQYLDDSKWDFYKYLVSIGQCLLETIACLGHPVSDGNAWFRDREKKGKSAKGRYVLLGIVILIPLLAVILSLLVSADAVFRYLAERMLQRINLWDITGITCMSVAVFFGIYSFIAMLNKGVIREACTERKRYEPVLAITVTSVLAVIYLIFCGIQVCFLFSGQRSLILPEGYTYASYAREGFFQLLWVCIINLIIVLTCMTCFGENRLLKGILTVISACTYVLVASSACRMILYISVYRLTFLRILVLWALAVIAVMLAGVIRAIFSPRFPLFRYLMVSATVLYILLAFARPDYWTARYNMTFVKENRAQAEEEAALYDDIHRGNALHGDYDYLSGLSADAAPVLASAENYEWLQKKQQMEFWYQRMEEKADSCGVRSFNLSRYLAGRALKNCGRS